MSSFMHSTEELLSFRRNVLPKLKNNRCDALYKTNWVSLRKTPNY